MDQIASILLVKGSIPRRAVLLPDGRLAEKTGCLETETDLVSRLCEVARAATGSPCYPRQTAALLECALADNGAGAWHAIRDDLVTGDLDMEVACVVLSQGSNASALVGCLVGSRSSRHLLHVCCLLARALEDSRLREECRAEMARALACQMRPLLDTLVVHGSGMPLDTRDAAYDGLGRVLAAAGLSGALVGDAVLHALERRREELLRLFLWVPASFVDHRPQILPALLSRLPRVSASCRYPALELLARILEHDPLAALGAERHVADVLVGSLRPAQATGGQGARRLDSRECLAVSRIAQCAGADPRVFEALAAGLRHTSAALIRGADPDFFVGST